MPQTKRQSVPQLLLWMLGCQEVPDDGDRRRVLGGAYKLPRFGTNDKAVEIDHPTVKDTVRDANGRILAKTKTTVRKLEVAQAGDMAYDVSDIEWTMQRKTPTGTKNEAGRFTTSRLMVWKKVDGVWRPAASFDFPHDGSYPNPAGPRAR